MRKTLTVLVAALLLMVAMATMAFAASGADLQKAQLLYDQGKYQESITILKEYVKNNPDPKAYFLLGYAHYKIGKYDEGRQYMDQAYMVEPVYTPTPELEQKQGGQPLKHVRPGTVPKGYYEKMGQQPDASATAPVMMSDTRPAQQATADSGTKSTGAMAIPLPDSQAPAAPISQTPAPETAPAQPIVAAPEAPATPVQEPQTSAPDASAAQEPVSAPVEAPAPPPRPRVQPRPAPAPSAGMMAALGAFALAIPIVFILLYLMFSFALFKAAKTLGVDKPFLAFIPIAQYWTLTKAADKSTLWFILTLVLGLPAIYLFMCVFERLGKNKLLGLSMLIAPIGIILFLIVALKSGGAVKPGKSKGADKGSKDFDESDLGMDDNDLGFDTDDLGLDDDDLGFDDTVADGGGAAAPGPGDDMDFDDMAGADDTMITDEHGFGGGDDDNAGFGSDFEGDDFGGGDADDSGGFDDGGFDDAGFDDGGDTVADDAAGEESFEDESFGTDDGYDFDATDEFGSDFSDEDFK